MTEPETGAARRATQARRARHRHALQGTSPARRSCALRRALLVLLLVCLGLLSACARAVAPGHDFGAFELRDTAGLSHSSAVLLSRGNLLVLYVWSVDCADSARVDPAIVALDASHGPRGVEVLALDPVAADDPARIAAAAGARDVPFPIVRDPHGRITARLGAARFPVAGVLDRRGTLLWRGPVGGLEAVLEAALGGRPLPASGAVEAGCEVP